MQNEVGATRSLGGGQQPISSHVVKREIKESQGEHVAIFLVRFSTVYCSLQPAGI